MGFLGVWSAPIMRCYGAKLGGIVARVVWATPPATVKALLIESLEKVLAVFRVTL